LTGKKGTRAAVTQSKRKIPTELFIKFFDNYSATEAQSHRAERKKIRKAEDKKQLLTSQLLNFSTPLGLCVSVAKSVNVFSFFFV
jgi:hypothetical protein